jgi:hypothetical protein
MIVYSEVDRLYGDCYDVREITSEIPVVIPSAFVVLYYCDFRRAFGRKVRSEFEEKYEIVRWI